MYQFVVFDLITVLVCWSVFPPKVRLIEPSWLAGRYKSTIYLSILSRCGCLSGAGGFAYAVDPER